MSRTETEDERLREHVESALKQSENEEARYHLRSALQRLELG